MTARRMIALAVFATLCLAAPAGAAQFTEIGRIINIPGTVGAGWGDYDGDGYPDLLLAASAPTYLDHPDMLLRNNHNLSFSDVSADVGLPLDQDESDGVAWADYDNDGSVDVFVGSAAGYDKLYHNEDGQFTNSAQAAGFTHLRRARTVSWCDYDGDNLLDVFVCYILDVSSCLYHNNGDGTFTDVTTAAGMTGLALPTSGNGCAWGDYDNDGLPDLIVSRFEGRPLLYHNNGNGTFAEIGSSFLSGIANTSGVAWADYDNNGWLDCYIASVDERRDWLLHSNQDGTFTDVAGDAGMGADVSYGLAVAWADYDNDGYQDLYVGNLEMNNQPFLYHNDGDGTFTNVAANSGLEGSRANEAAMWADLDLDGRLDLFQGSAVSYLFHNIGPAGNWLRVRALTSGTGNATGSYPTRDAIGARVDLNLDNDDSFPTDGQRTLARLIDGGSGFCAQNEQIAQFGLGSRALVAVRVRFPDGSIVIHRSVPANQQITIRDVPAGRSEIFDDVPIDSWAYTQVKDCVDAAIVAGYEDGLYHPELPVTRDQMAVYIARALAGGDSNVPAFTGTPTFPDVPTGNWALKYVEFAVDQSVVTGYEDGTYKPANQVTRDQMAVYIARAMVAPSGEAGLADYVPSDPRNFPDVASTFWSYKHIEYCVEHGVVNGYEDGNYHPEITVTRDQMAVYVARAFGLL